MRKHTEDLLAHLRTHHARVRDALDRIPEPERRNRPGEDRWSAAEIVEHLGIVEQRFLAMVQKAPMTSDAPAQQPQIELPLDRILDRTTRVTAAESSIPTGGIDAEEAWKRLDGARRELEKALIDRDEADLSLVMRDHARFGPMNLYQWIYFCGAHEGRHALQIEEGAGGSSEF